MVASQEQDIYETDDERFVVALERIAGALEGISLKMANPYYIPNPIHVGSPVPKYDEGYWNENKPKW